MFSPRVHRILLCLAYYLCAILLLTCMDVESNPGPEENNVLQFVDWRFNQVMHGLQVLYNNLSSNMDDRFKTLESTIHRFSAEVSHLKNCVQHNEEEIADLREDNESIYERLQRLEDKVDATELELKRTSLKNFGVEELRKDDHHASIQQIVDILNCFSPSITWHDTDISRAFRIGNRRQRSEEPRPLLVQFCRWSDKMAVLTDRNLRNDLRENGIRVTSDLTSRQKEMVSFYRDQGKTAYYYNGKLYVSDKQQGPQQRHGYQDADKCFDQNVSCDSDDWPRLHHVGRHNQDRYWEEWKSTEPSMQKDYNRHGTNKRHDRHYKEDQCQYKFCDRNDMNRGEDNDYREDQQRYPFNRNGTTRKQNKEYQEDQYYEHKYNRQHTNKRYEQNYQEDQSRQRQSRFQLTSPQQLVTGEGRRTVHSAHLDNHSSDLARRQYGKDSLGNTEDRPIVPGVHSYSHVTQRRSLPTTRGREEHTRLVRMKGHGRKPQQQDADFKHNNDQQEGPSVNSDIIHEDNVCPERTLTDKPEYSDKDTVINEEQRLDHPIENDNPVHRDDPDYFSEGDKDEQESIVEGPTEQDESVCEDELVSCDQNTENNVKVTDKVMIDMDINSRECVINDTNTFSVNKTHIEINTDDTNQDKDRQTDKQTIINNGHEESVSSKCVKTVKEKEPKKAKAKITKANHASPLGSGAQAKLATPKTRTRSQTNITDSFKKVQPSRGTGEEEDTGQLTIIPPSWK